MASVKEYLSNVLADRDSFLWALTLVGICVLVGMHRVEPKLLEYMVMAIVGRASVGKTGSK